MVAETTRAANERSVSGAKLAERVGVFEAASRIFNETGLMRLRGIMLLGNGAVSPGNRIARVAAGLASRGYQRFPGIRISERSPERIAIVGTVVREGVPLRSRRPS